jgi:hypothetical protein
MANSPVSNPIIIDTDITSYRQIAAVVAAGGGQGIRVSKLVLAVGSVAGAAGTVFITAPSDSATLYPPIAVGATPAAYTIILNDNITSPGDALTWRDFAVTGVTATGTRLFLWTKV